jgi:hypothetical protein
MGSTHVFFHFAMFKELRARISVVNKRHAGRFLEKLLLVACDSSCVFMMAALYLCRASMIDL